MLGKTDVNGKDENEIFTFLKSRCQSPDEDFRPSWALLYEPKHARDIRWNFEKFLVDASGTPIYRYSPSVNPNLMMEDIEYLLSLA